METGTGNPNVGRWGRKQSVTTGYKSGQLGTALVAIMDQFYGETRPNAVEFGAGYFVEANGVLTYSEPSAVEGAPAVGVALALMVWDQNWQRNYGKPEGAIFQTYAAFLGRCAIETFDKAGRLDVLKDWIQPVNPMSVTEMGYYTGGKFGAPAYKRPE